LSGKSLKWLHPDVPCTCGQGSATDPTVRLLAGFKGPTSKGRGGKRRGGKGREREGQEGKGGREWKGAYRYFLFPTSSSGYCSMVIQQQQQNLVRFNVSVDVSLANTYAARGPSITAHSLVGLRWCSDLSVI